MLRIHEEIINEHEKSSKETKFSVKSRNGNILKEYKLRSNFFAEGITRQIFPFPLHLAAFFDSSCP